MENEKNQLSKPIHHVAGDVVRVGWDVRGSSLGLTIG
jgi:hypothetical protein